MRAAVRHVVAGGLAFADRDGAAVVAGRLEQSERRRVDMRDRKRAGVRRSGGQVGGRLQATEEVRLLEERAGRVLGCRAELGRVGHATMVGNLDDLEPEAGGVGLHHLAHLRIDESRQAPRANVRLRAWRCSRRRPRPSCRRSLTRSKRPARSARRSRSGTRRSPATHPGSSRAGTAYRRSAARHARARRRPPRGRSGRRCPPRGTRARCPCGRSWTPARRGAPRAPAPTALEARRAAGQAEAFRDVHEELVDRRDADRLEHLLTVRVCEREVAH